MSAPIDIETGLPEAGFGPNGEIRFWRVHRAYYNSQYLYVGLIQIDSVPVRRSRSLGAAKRYLKSLGYTPQNARSYTFVKPGRVLGHIDTQYAPNHKHYDDPNKVFEEENVLEEIRVRGNHPIAVRNAAWRALKIVKKRDDREAAINLYVGDYPPKKLVVPGE